MTDRPSDTIGEGERGRKWCFHCQCFHLPPWPKASDCRAAAKARGEDKSGMIQDMLDYN